MKDFREQYSESSLGMFLVGVDVAIHTAMWQSPGLQPPLRAKQSRSLLGRERGEPRDAVST